MLFDSSGSPSFFVGPRGQPANDGEFYSLVPVADESKIRFFYAPDLTEVEAITLTTTKDGSASPITGVHSWAIVKTNDTIRLYFDGDLVDEKSVTDKEILSTAAAIQFGAPVANVRYYNQALTEKQIKQNFKVDSRRYGIRKTVKIVK